MVVLEPSTLLAGRLDLGKVVFLHEDQQEEGVACIRAKQRLLNRTLLALRVVDGLVLAVQDASSVLVQVGRGLHQDTWVVALEVHVQLVHCASIGMI